MFPGGKRGRPLSANACWRCSHRHADFENSPAHVPCGAGGSTSAAWLYRMAPKDGTAILSVSPNAILGKLLDESQTQYDPTRFLYLAGAERGIRLCMTFQHSKVKTFDDAVVQRAM